MLSYRHAFHAGNHADVLKHFVFSQVLQYFNQKDKPYWVIDTHAGAGMYRLKEKFAQKNGEYENGIAKLIAAEHLTPELTEFSEMIQSFNQENDLDVYPGSPSIAKHYARPLDILRLHELHPTDVDLLSEHFSQSKRQVKIQQLDGYQGLKSCLPPATKRAVTLIDPSYELHTDYDAVVKSIKDSLKRFTTGTYLIWYPLLPRDEPKHMLENLLSLDLPNWLNVTLSVEAPQDEFGMYGSGMLVINPPWTLPQNLSESMPLLTELLALDEEAEFTLNSEIQ